MTTIAAWTVYYRWQPEEWLLILGTLTGSAFLAELAWTLERRDLREEVGDVQEELRHERAQVTKLLDEIQGLRAENTGLRDQIDALRSSVTRIPGELPRSLQRASARQILYDPRRPRKSDDLSLTTLLRAEYAIVPFYGRQDLVADVKAWCNRSDSISVRLYTGRGGIGKTRLFVELCADLAANGWHAGFLHETAELSAPVLDALLEEHQSVCIVIDYAETRRAQLIPLLRHVIDSKQRARCRFILLARAAGDWWTSIRQEREIAKLLHGPGVSLPPVAPPADREVVFRQAAEAFAQVLGQTKNLAALKLPDLNQPHFERVLLIHLAALAAILGQQLEKTDELLNFVLDRESRVWRDGLQARGLPDTLKLAVGQAVALTTLVGGVFQQREAEELIDRTPLLADHPRTVRLSVADLLRDLYPGERGGVEALSPDLLGERLIAEYLARDRNQRLLDIATDGDNVQIGHALAVLTRMAQREMGATEWLRHILASKLDVLAEVAMYVAAAIGGPIGQALAQALEANPNPALAYRLESQVPQETVALRDLSVVVTQICYDDLSQLPEPKSEAVRAKLARITRSLANRLGDLGREEEALKKAEEAVALYVDLDRAHPHYYVLDLVMAFNNLAQRLNLAGRHEKALQMTKSVLDYYRRGAEARPDIFLPGLAAALHNLSLSLLSLEQREEALKYATEAAALFRHLAPDSADPALHYRFGKALRNLADVLSDFGRYEDALQAAQEAADLYVTLARGHLDAFGSDLALSRYQVSVFLSKLGRHEDSLQAAQEAAGVYRELAEANPDASRLHLAVILRDVGAILKETGRVEEAVDTVTSGIIILRDEFLRHPTEATVNAMTMMTSDYLSLTQSLGRDTDSALLEPILSKIEECKRPPH